MLLRSLIQISVERQQQMDVGDLLWVYWIKQDMRKRKVELQESYCIFSCLYFSPPSTAGVALLFVLKIVQFKYIEYFFFYLVCICIISMNVVTNHLLISDQLTSVRPQCAERVCYKGKSTHCRELNNRSVNHSLFQHGLSFPKVSSMDKQPHQSYTLEASLKSQPWLFVSWCMQWSRNDSIWLVWN